MPVQEESTSENTARINEVMVILTIVASRRLVTIFRVESDFAEFATHLHSTNTSYFVVKLIFHSLNISCLTV
jgi:hypothetical protein